MNLVDDILVEDGLGCILRGHIHIENRLDQFLSIIAKNEEQLRKADLRYSQKVALALALGLPSWLASPLNYIGKLRNEFAHNLDRKIGKQEVDNFYRTFPGEEKISIQKATSNTHKRMKQPDIPFKEMPEIDQFRMCAMTVEAAVRVATQKRANEI